MDRKNLYILLMRLSAVLGVLCGLLTVFFDFTIVPSMLGVVGFFFFRFLAIRQIQRDNREE